MVRSPSSSVCTVGAADARVPIERDATENANFQREGRARSRFACAVRFSLLLWPLFQGSGNNMKQNW